MFDTLEFDLFRRYGLDPRKVHFYRSRLAKKSPITQKAVRAKLRRRAMLQKRLEKSYQEMCQFEQELNDSGLCYDRWECLTNGIGQRPWGARFAWNVEEARWDDEADDPERMLPWNRGKIIERYTSRPEKPQALRLWNRMLVAFRQEPKEILRVRGDGYWAVLTDCEGKPIHIGDGSIDLSS